MGMLPGRGALLLRVPKQGSAAAPCPLSSPALPPLSAPTSRSPQAAPRSGQGAMEIAQNTERRAGHAPTHRPL